MAFPANDDIAKGFTPRQMLSSLINSTNGTSLNPADFQLRNLQVVTGQAWDTSVELDITSDDVSDNYVELTYTRIDLPTLFSVIQPSIRQVDVPMDNGMPVDIAAFWAELQRKYQVNFGDTAHVENMFEATKGAPGIIVVTAAANNVAYTGAVDVSVGSSLAARVSNVILDGFRTDSIVDTTPVAP